MTFRWTDTQKLRLKALAAEPGVLERDFESESQRDRHFQDLERRLVRHRRLQLEQLREEKRQPGLCRLEARLTTVLVERQFVQVTTPIIMSRPMIEKMSIGNDHALNRQIFWVDDRHCLRPMLAPHLYYVLKDLLRLWSPPVSIFEVGPCFRKESQGARHANEFTMLNVVEMGLSEDARQDRLLELAGWVMQAAGIADYRLRPEQSDVYGQTLDILAGDPEIEIASGAVGPHALDRAWKIHHPWVGIGFGLERMLMVAERRPNLASVARSLGYLDGIKLNI